MRHFDQTEAGFKAVGMVTHKARPQVASWDQLTQVRHHLTTVTHAECQRLRAMEEGFELITDAVVEQNRLRPTFTSAKHIAVREAAAGHQRLEVTQADTSAQQVAHVHIDGVETRTVEGCCHFNVGVHALLAQYGHFGTRTGGDVRSGNIFVDIKRQFNVETRVRIVGFSVVFLIGAFRIVTQTLHLPGGFRPPHTQGCTAFAKHRLAVSGQVEAVTFNGFTKEVYAVCQAMGSQNRFHRLTLSSTNLNHRTQFFVKQRRQTIFTQRVDISVNTAVTGEGHFRQRNQQTAVRTVMIGQQLTRSDQRLNRIVEAFQLLNVTHVGRLIAQLTVNLRQRRSAQRIVTKTEVNQQQGVVFSRQLRGNGVAHIFYAGKGGNHQRQRRGHFTLLVTFLPAGFHRHRVFTHWNGQAERRA